MKQCWILYMKRKKSPFNLFVNLSGVRFFYILHLVSLHLYCWAFSQKFSSSDWTKKIIFSLFSNLKVVNFCFVEDVYWRSSEVTALVIHLPGFSLPAFYRKVQGCSSTRLAFSFNQCCGSGSLWCWSGSRPGYLFSLWTSATEFWLRCVYGSGSGFSLWCGSGSSFPKWCRFNSTSVCNVGLI